MDKEQVIDAEVVVPATEAPAVEADPSKASFKLPALDTDAVVMYLLIQAESVSPEMAASYRKTADDLAMRIKQEEIIKKFRVV